jgi:hypothetical protein
LIYPDFAGFHEWIAYAGCNISVSCLRFIQPGKLADQGILVPVLWISLLCAGGYLPLGAWITQLPGFGWLRVPARALFLTGMAISALAGTDWRIMASRIRLKPAIELASLWLVGQRSWQAVFGSCQVFFRLSFSGGHGPGPWIPLDTARHQ